MKQKSFEEFHKSKLGEQLNKETTKARYENKEHQKPDTPLKKRDSLADLKIKQAISEGVLDDLPGKGKPIDLNEYFGLPEHLRMGYQMLKKSGFVPEEVRLKAEMERLKEQIETCPSPNEKQKIMKRLAQVSQDYHFYMEYNKGFKKTFY